MHALMCKVRSLLFLTQEALIISFRILLVRKFEFTKQLINYGFNIVCIYVLFFFFNLQVCDQNKSGNILTYLEHST